jgi:2,3-bisphosphoglycerate-independent phosphoglycerate mutase
MASPKQASPRQKTVLCVLDGLGLNPNPRGNAVAAAKTPCLNGLLATCPNSTLVTFGERVGLPEGQMGNSEVGHLNIGAGRVVEQWLLRISRALKGDYIAASEPYRSLLTTIDPSRTMHVIGLFSDGGVHSHSDHLLLLLERLSKDFSGRIALHLITDGRDTSPQRAHNLVEKLLHQIAELQNVMIATVSGRFYAMDRDNRWERTQRAYDAIVHGKGISAADPLKFIEFSYHEEVTDEFIEPAVCGYEGVTPGDGVIFWNFRADRMRQIVRSLCVSAFDGFARSAPPFQPAQTLCFTDYDQTFHLPFLFPTDEIRDHLGAVIAKESLRQLRVAETEKYPHVTYFLNGGQEAASPLEDRVLIPSPRDVKTYDLKPEMSAREVTDAVVDAIAEDKHDFIVVNFANCDMVGHTGILDAAVSAVETVDTCLQRLLNNAKSHGWQVLIIADHGNAEQMINYEDGTPHTAHTTYPVPIILFNAARKARIRSGGALCDVAPTVLHLMDVAQPPTMTGTSLVEFGE